MLEIADERIRAVICILSSTGIRLGALPELRLRHLEDTNFTIYDTRQSKKGKQTRMSDFVN